MATGKAIDGATVDAIDPRLAAWERRATPWIIASAIVPVAAAFIRHEPDDPLTVLDFVTWVVFLVDLVVHVRYRRNYLRSGVGKFDLTIVVLSFPWYVIPGLGSTMILGLARIGRILRLVVAGTSTGLVQRLVARLGKAGLYSVVLILVCSEVVYRVEPASSGFETRGDACWWGIVTFTTVGYGDLYPTTLEGRIVATMLMIGGIALIGLLSGSLAQLFSAPARSDDAAEGEPAEPDAPTDPVLVLDEVRAIRTELAELRRLVASRPDPLAPPAD